MSKADRFYYSEVPKERGFLVGADMRTHRFQQGVLPVEDSLEELGALADTAHVEVIGATYQKLNRPNSATLIGAGKVEELKAYKDDLDIEVFVFDDELSPRQHRVLEKELDVKVIDRTALILDIFAQHARTKEGQLQVELAQLEYRLPRLTRMWTHLARQAGGQAGGAGGVGVRGPGETQLEVDRREINRKITYLKKKLEQVRLQRANHRARRKQQNLPVVAIVGYTNAGKSTLLNALVAQAGLEADRPSIYAADQLFATLDPTTRRIRLPGGLEILFSDTVGFIQKLPTQLVAAFRATLEEVKEANLLLHVVDITHSNALEQAQAVEDTLRALDATQAPIVTALNKIDAFQDRDDLDIPLHLAEFENSVSVSAKSGQGIEDLLERIASMTKSDLRYLNLTIPYAESRLIAKLHETAMIESEQAHEAGIDIVAYVPKQIAHTFEPFLRLEE
ncbi:MAG: GTPase HflX [Chloroflexota bacterium]